MAAVLELALSFRERSGAQTVSASYLRYLLPFIKYGNVVPNSPGAGRLFMKTSGKNLAPFLILVALTWLFLQFGMSIFGR